MDTVSEPVGPVNGPAADNAPPAEGPPVGEPPFDEFPADGPAFDEPTFDEPTFDGPSFSVPPVDGPSVDRAPVSEIADGDTPVKRTEYIPRDLFLFSGLSDDSFPGMDPVTGDYYGPPDPYNSRYTKPPAGWPGVALNGELMAYVVDPEKTRAANMAGNVNQDLFLEYDQVYVRRVTAQNNAVTVLGAIRPPNSDSLVYYYTTQIGQSTDVSATVLPDGEQFVVQYTHLEYSIQYQIRFRPSKDEFLKLADANGKLTLAGYDLMRNPDTYGPVDTYKDSYLDYNKDYGTSNAPADIADWVRQLPELANKEVRGVLGRLIFGQDFPTMTDEGRYAFNATAPDGYTLAFYLSDTMQTPGAGEGEGEGGGEGSGEGEGEGEEAQPGTWINGTAQLVTREGYTGRPGAYKAVNGGWALGMEPEYYWDGTNKLMPVTDDPNKDPHDREGPEELVTSATFYNNDVTANRIVVAVLKKKDTPRFDAYTLFKGVDADKTELRKDNNIDNIWDRGTVAVRYIQLADEKTVVPYDYEDVYRWATTGTSKYGYTYRTDKGWNDQNSQFYVSNSEGSEGYWSGTTLKNVKDGNILTGDRWQWRNTKEALIKPLIVDYMTPEKDEEGRETGTYSFEWTWQTNSDESFMLDTLEINRIGVAIPFHTKNRHGDGKKANDEEFLGDKTDDSGGRLSWWAETRLPDGAVVRVEYLMIFWGNGITPQRVYRIKVTGARNNITVTSMNVMQYQNGAPEIAVYQLDGITGATEKDENGNTVGIRRAAIQYYENYIHKGSRKDDPNPPRTMAWSNNVARGAVIVEDGTTYAELGPDNKPIQTGTHTGASYKVGCEELGGANIRFKVASGYSNPCYLFETSEAETVYDKNNDVYLASIRRNGDLSLDRTSQYPVVPYISNGTDPYMKYFKELSEDQQAALRESCKNAIGDDFDDKDPVPVDIKGNLMYYRDGDGSFKIFTEWNILRFVDVHDDTAAGQVLVPELYSSSAGGTPLSKDDVIATRGTLLFENDPKMNPKYIYSGPDKDPNAADWCYIRLSDRPHREPGSGDAYPGKYALLTVVAFPTRYVVRYKPDNVPDYEGPNGTIEGEEPTAMPHYEHYPDSCPTFFHQDNDKQNLREQFDDNGGDFYDVVEHPDVALTYAKPTDPNSNYRFVDWVLVDEHDAPIEVHDLDSEGRWLVENGRYVTHQVHFSSGSFKIQDYADYAIFNSDLGAIDDDIYVLRMLPTWEKGENPFRYKVALRWVDAQGNLKEMYFDDESEGELWQRVLTDFEQTEDRPGPAVKVLPDAEPFQNWIAQYPTYTFWDSVNNALDGEAYNAEAPNHIVVRSKEPSSNWNFPSDWKFLDCWDSEKRRFKDFEDDKELCAEEKILKALLDYFPDYDDVAEADKDNWKTNFQKVYEAILDRDRKYDGEEERNKEGDDFIPLGNYTYEVHEDYGTIVVWMFEDKGGLVFHKAVDAEPFTTDEEFYFTVRQVEVGTAGEDYLNGVYKAYPEKVYNERTGEERTRRASDAWRINFENGEIANIVKNDGSAWPNPAVKYFTVKDGEGIQLYVPAGKYTISELGSSSGGSYRTEVAFVAAEDGPGDPEDPEKKILKGMEQVPKEGWVFPISYQWLKGSEKEYKGRDTKPSETPGDDGDPYDSIEFPEGISQVSATVNFKVGENDIAHIINFSNQTSAVAIENQVVGPYSGEAMGYDVALILPKGVSPLKDKDESGKEYAYFNFNLYGVTYPEGTKAKYMDEYGMRPDLSEEPDAPPDRNNYEAYKEWLKDKQADWLRSDGYRKWWAWHTWRPDGLTEVTTSGRMVVKAGTVIKSDGSEAEAWAVQYLLVPKITELGAMDGWTRLHSEDYDGKIWLTSGQRFYVVCAVPEQGDINYIINETESRSYTPDSTRRREDTAVAAELSYELFINSKLAGLPRTGGIGSGVFRLSGVVFLTSGLGLAWLNRDLRKQRRREAVPASGRRRGGSHVEKRWGK